MDRARLKEAYARFAATFPGAGLFVLGADGEVLDNLPEVPGHDPQLISAELLTLLRIARSASQDAGIGRVEEVFLTTDESVVATRVQPDGSTIVAVVDRGATLGRLRYELRRLAASTSPGTAGPRRNLQR